MPSSGCKTCARSEEHTSELQSHDNLVCRLLLEKKISQPIPSPSTMGGGVRGPWACWWQRSSAGSPSSLLTTGEGKRERSVSPFVVFFEGGGAPGGVPASPTGPFS